MPPYVYALILHGAIGFLDLLINHEWLSKLPSRRECIAEERLHSAREFLFAALFAAALLVSARDVVVEGEVRALPASERFLHLFLFMNLGVMYTLTGQALLAWHALPARLAPVDHGWASWVLTAMALGALGWAFRDGIAARRLGYT